MEDEMEREAVPDGYELVGWIDGRRVLRPTGLGAILADALANAPTHLRHRQQEKQNG